MRVPAEAVADALGISRMPVRDALRRLEGDGAVMIFPNRGAAVAEYSRDEVVQLIEMRAVLEGLAARLVVPHVTAAEIAELRHRKLQMERSSDDLAKWMANHDGFHNYLTSLSGRPLLMKQTQRMRLMLNPYYRRYYEQSRELEILGLEHQKIIDTIEYKDANHAENPRARVRSIRVTAKGLAVIYTGGTIGMVAGPCGFSPTSEFLKEIDSRDGPRDR